MTMSTLDIGHVVHDAAVVVRPVGRLDLSTYPLLRDALLGHAAEQPAALIVDLDGIEAEAVTSLSVFTTVRMRISSWPAIPMLLSASRSPLSRLLRRSAVPRFVPTFNHRPRPRVKPWPGRCSRTP